MRPDHLKAPKALKTDAELVALIAQDQGMPIEELLERTAIDSVAPGICTVCLAVIEPCEPDAEENYCEECEDNSVKSVLVLAGLI